MSRSAFDVGAPAVQPVGRPRRRVRRLPALIVLALVVGAAGTGGTLIAAREAIDSIERVPAVDDVLSGADAQVENYLLVGSDSRAGIDPSAPDFGATGDETVVSGRRSDTMMILRVDKGSGSVSLLSIPRDLWVDIPGHGEQRINSAYNHGPEVLVETIQQSLGIPLHHYVEIDFVGFKELVDAIGGVQLCFLFPSRDTHTGFNFAEPGCAVVDGVQALAYARSRYFEEYRDGDWRIDGSADLGRTQRQRQFVKDVLEQALDRSKADPFVIGDVLRDGGAAIRADGDLDVVDAVSTLRDAVAEIASYPLPVRGETIDGNAVLTLTSDADAVLAWFRGDGPVPVTSE